MKNEAPLANEQTQCRCCGTCCRKGGPTLHIEDQPLVDAGKIPLKHLMTFRQGEPVYDNVADRIAPAVTDIIKIKAAQGTQAQCPFYNPENKGCRIYDHRPLECKALQCWDATQIETIYNTRRLTRRHLLSKVEGLWALVTDHQQLCDYGHIADLADTIRQQPDDQTCQEELLELIRYDQSIRQITIEQSKLEEEVLDFLFGRPLSFTITLFQLKLSKTAQGTTLETTGSPQDPVCYRRGGFTKS
jgi:Fe-S-cluster containining protein